MATNSKKQDDLDKAVNRDTNLHACTSCQLDGVHVQAAGYCLICVEYLCLPCYKGHLIPLATRNHILLPMAQMPDKKIVKREDRCEVVCPEHKGILIEYYCSKCDVVGCCECMKGGHHQCVEVSTVQAHVKREELRKNKIYNDSWYCWRDSPIDKVANIKNKAERYKFGVEIKASEARKQVKEFREQVVEALDILENEMDNKINTASNEDLIMLDMLFRKCDIVKDKFEKIKNKVEISKSIDGKRCNLFVNSKIAEYEVRMFEKNEVIENLQEYLKIKTIQFEPNFRDANGENIVLGDIVEVPNKPKEKKEWKDLGRINAKTIEEIEKSKESTSILNRPSCSVCACIVLNDGKLMLCDNDNNSVRLCNTENGKFSEDVSDVISVVGVEATPVDITEMSDDFVAVTLPSAKKIQYIEFVEDDKIEKEASVDVSGECCGIGCLDETLIVSYRNPGKVEFLDFEGHVLKTVSNDKYGNLKFLKPLSVTCDDSRKLIYISDFDGNFVVAVNLEGKVKSVFKQSGMTEPLAITLGKDGSVLVAVKWPFSVQRISPYFLEIEELQVKGDTWGIQCVAYSSVQDRLFYGNGSCYVNIRKLN